MSEITMSYREQQIGMLKEALAESQEACAALRLELSLALDRAERAETSLRNLREEIAEARRTPFG